VQDVVQRLMEVVRETTTDPAVLARRSSEVAGWAVDAYYDAREPLPLARETGRARIIRISDGARVSRDAKAPPTIPDAGS